MQVDQAIVDRLREYCITPGKPVMFWCRSAAHSKTAATATGFKAAFNVAGDFEGDPTENKHRGNKNGWKHDGLPWVQQ